MGLRDELAPYETGGRGSGEASRWDGDRDLEWIEMRPELVAEVGYDHASDGRIRHGAQVAALARRPRPAVVHVRPARLRGVSAAARLRAQGLGEARARDAHGAVGTALAIQAQDTRASRLGVRARSEGLVVADVARACDEERSVVRTWAMRGTLHMLGRRGRPLGRRAARARSWLRRVRPPAGRAGPRPRRSASGSSPPSRRSLADGPLSRAELMDALTARGTAIDTSGQAPAHVVLLACASGLTCRGPDRHAGRADLRPARRLGRPRARAATGTPPWPSWPGASAPPTGRPARDDLRYWSGMPGRRRRAAPGTLAGPPPPPPRRRGPSAAPPAPRVRRRACSATATAPRSWPPPTPPKLAAGAWILPSVVAGGRVVGTWRREGDAVLVRPFAGRLPRGSVRALRAEAADVGRFLGVPARLEVAA